MVPLHSLTKSYNTKLIAVDSLLEAMSLSDQHVTGTWEHIHRCPQCEHIVKGEDIPHSAIATGILTCSDCGFSGPINLQIVPEDPGTAPNGDGRATR